MDAVNPLNILNTLNLEHGGALNGCCESAVNPLNTLNSHEFGTWWCFEHSGHSEFGIFEWML